jgi:hypothetical protein
MFDFDGANIGLVFIVFLFCEWCGVIFFVFLKLFEGAVRLRDRNVKN